MDKVSYERCMHFLERAEQCMDARVDGLHLARLSHVVETLRDAYDPDIAKMMTIYDFWDSGTSALN